MYKIKLARSKKEGNDRFWQLPTPTFSPKEVDVVKPTQQAPLRTLTLLNLWDGEQDT